MAGVETYLRTLETFLVEGRQGGVSAPEAVEALKALRAHIAASQIRASWYTHRIVRHERCVGVRTADSPEVVEMRRRLRREVEREVEWYRRSHVLCQVRVDDFCAYGPEADLVVWVVATLYGPPDMKREILEEHIRKEIVDNE